ncbi:MAG TPA: beta-propeller fold lactonase family protein, partial [Gemmatimonadales bacterium]|nr:beta-propeller fold lactonase family protein [Gemmatimonadales bacterium]
DPGGQFVLTANGSSNSVSVFRIGSTGALSEVAGSPFAAGADPEAVVVTQGGHVYAANAGGGSVSAYSLSTTTGSLTPVAGSPFAVGGNPQGLVVDPSGTHLYAAGSQAVSGLTIDLGTGALTSIPGSPFTAPNGALSVVMDGAGKLLHVANGTNVDCYTVDSSSGALTYIGPSVTNGRAVALAVDAPDGFLYALDNVSNQIEVFSIGTVSYNLALIGGNPYPLFPGAATQSLAPSSITVVH